MVSVIVFQSDNFLCTATKLNTVYSGLYLISTHVLRPWKKYDNPKNSHTFLIYYLNICIFLFTVKECFDVL